MDDAEGELTDDVKDACGHDLVKRILNECLEPTQKSQSNWGTIKNGMKTGPRRMHTAVATTPNATTIRAKPSVATAANHSKA